MKFFTFLLLVLFVNSSFSQDFQKQWKEIYELEQKQSYKTLQKKVDDLYQSATKSKNQQQQAKALLFQLKVENVLKETTYQQKASRLQKQITQATGVYASIYRWYYLKTLLATYDAKQRYWRRNSLVETTTTKLPEEIDLWSENQFKQQIIEQANLLFADEIVLKNTPLSKIKELVNYDAIDNNLNQNAYEFFATTFIKDYAYNSYLVKENFTTIERFDDRFSKQKLALPFKNDNIRSELGKLSVLVLQKLEAYYIANNQKKALDKIRFLRFDTYTENKNSKGEAFQDLGKNLQTNFYKNRWKALHAQKLVNEADKVQNKDYFEKALKLIAEVKLQKDENDQLLNVHELEETIKERRFAVALKKEVYENEPVKYRIDYKNIDTLHFAYYDFSKHEILNDSVYQLLLKEKPLKVTTKILPKDLPYFKTSTEVLGENVPLGSYVMVVYDTEYSKNDFDYQKIIPFKTTNVYVVSKNKDREFSTIYILHPKTGNPYVKTAVRFNNNNYITDDFGKITVSNKRDDNYTNSLVVYAPKEIYRKNLYVDGYGQYVTNENKKRDAKIELFTDRALYRPGQEVHFKGILYEMLPEGNQTLANKSFQVVLEDDNGDAIEKKKVTTNALGGFSGVFVLPKSIATGEFSLVMEELETYENKDEEAFWNELLFPDETFDYRVEEYKRPTFDVTLEEVKKHITFNEQVTIKGKATSFSGGAIANAKVNLHVNATYYDRSTYKSLKIVDIKEAVFTNAQGDFDYTFIVPNDSLQHVLKKEEVNVNVNFSVEIVDPSGEVREDDRSFTVSNNKHNISVYKYDEAKTDKPLKVTINSTEKNGAFDSVKGKVKIYQTLPNAKYYKNRPWELPEIASINEADFRKLFPYETYSKEDDKKPEPVLIYEGNYTTQKDEMFSLDIKNWKTGNYELSFETTDELSGLPIFLKTNFNIKKADEKLATNENFKVTTNEKSSASQLVLETNSIYDNAYVFLEYFDRDATVKSTKLLVKKGTQLHQIPLAKANENETISYQCFFVNEQEVYTENGSFSLKAKEKEATPWDVEWQVWNDKLNPAQQYQWKLLIKNAKNNKAFQGEFLASMYDASLDRLFDEWENEQFSWNTNPRKLNNEAYVSFSDPQKHNKVYSKRWYNNYNGYLLETYWNTWKYYGYNFDISSYYDLHYKTDSEDFLKGNTNYFQVEVRDVKTGEFISNAWVYNLKTGSETKTNADGFTKIEGAKTALVGIVALGYEELRVELKKETTIIHLQPKEKAILSEDYEALEKILETWRKIYFYYQEEFADASKSNQNNIQFIEAVTRKDSVVKNYQMDYDDLRVNGREDREADKDGDFKSKGQITGGAEKASKGTGSGSRFKDDSITVSSKTIVGRPNASMLQTLQGQVPGLNIAKNDAETAENHKAIALRKNLQETAFFFPHLGVSKKGEVEINFTAPEALTEWKFRGLAHNKNMEMLYVETLSKTQKDVMIQPNMPRFVRETDQIVLKARVSNTTNTPIKATAMLRLFNTVTDEEVSSKIIKSTALVPVTIEGFSASTVSWHVNIPENIEGLQYRISVQVGNFTDGEESVIPVLSNRQLVTETLPIWQLANENKTYGLTNLIENKSKSLENHQLRVDFSNNATWLLLQSFPYLMEYPHQCSEQLFAKYFANVLAVHVLENNKTIQELVTEWKENPKSKLEENEELKQVLLQETPWMKDLISDEEKKAQFASFFDTNRLNTDAEKIEDQLTERQLPSGALPWFSGGYENQYITNHILVTVAQLQKLGVKNPFLDNKEGFVNKAQRYLDVQFENQFKNKQEASFSEVIDYAFVKSYYKDTFSISKENQTKLATRLEALKKDWVSLSLYQKAKLAIVAQRMGDVDWTKKIIHQLEESAVIDETYGMYWKENTSSNYDYYNAAEVQSLIIEAYKEVGMPQDKIQRLYAWLISQKTQTDWGTTKVTTQALYAVLVGQQGVNLEKGALILNVGKEKIKESQQVKSDKETAVGHYSYRWLGDEVTSEMGNISLKNTTNQPVFGGVYWQYFEDMSAIKSSQKGLLNISRTYTTETSDGKWQEINEQTVLKLGQKVKIRVTIAATKDMSFVHIKDVRPATFEPIDVLSAYHYKNGVRYYQSTKDAATHFFVDQLTKGTYVLEYDVRINNEGTFTSGISTIQSMYAPEHTGHSSATKLEVK